MQCARVLMSTSLFAGITLAGTAAFADEDGLRLAWNAPAGCPSGDDVKSATLKSVDRGRMLSGTLRADASVEQLAPESWRVRLKTQRGENAGEREIEGPTCAGVADATAVILALALVPPTTLEEPAPPPPPRPTEPDRPSPKPAERESHRVAAGIAVVGNAGGLPKFGVGGELSLAWTPWRFRFEAEGRLLGGQHEDASGSTVGARFSRKELGGRGCFAVLRGSSFDVAPCLGMTAVFMSADGDSDPSLRVTGVSQSKVWAAFDGAVFGRYLLTNWLALRARFEVDVPLYNPSFEVKDQGKVFEPPTIGAAGTFGAEVLFL